MKLARNPLNNAPSGSVLYNVYDTKTLERVYSGYSRGYAYYLVNMYAGHRLEETLISDLVFPDKQEPVQEPVLGYQVVTVTIPAKTWTFKDSDLVSHSNGVTFTLDSKVVEVLHAEGFFATLMSGRVEGNLIHKVNLTPVIPSKPSFMMNVGQTVALNVNGSSYVV